MQPENENNQILTTQDPYQQEPIMQQPILPDEPKHHSGIGIMLLIVVLLLLLIGSIGFGFWAFSERNDYKNNVDEKVQSAITTAVEEANAAKEADFAERAKSPHDEYNGPAAFGSVTVKYPRTWSAFVTEEDKGFLPVDGYFHPKVIPGLRSGAAFAFRLQVVNSDYAKELAKFDGDSRNGKVKVNPVEYQGVPGARVDGEIEKDKKGSIVLLPIRDKTLKLITESESFAKDFNEIILPNFTFSP